MFCFFLKRSWRCNFPPNKRGRQRSWPCIFPPKNNPGNSTYRLLHVSQCEMRHSNPVPQHGVYSALFPVLSLFVLTQVSPVCYRSQLLSLTSNFASSSPVFSISFYLPFFALHVCRLIHKLSWCFVVHVVFKIFFFLSNAVGDAISCQTNAASSAVGHAFSRRKKPDWQHKV